MTSEPCLQLPTRAEQRMSIYVFDVHEEMKVRANDKIGSERLPLATRDLAPNGSCIKDASACKSSATAR